MNPKKIARSKRGLEDWEIVEKIPESQKPVPYWFFAVVVVVLLVGIGLSFPFWGLRPGDNRPWLDWGFLIALVYIAVAGSFVWYMVRMFGSEAGPPGRRAAEDRKAQG
jgi:drug/metabolite transporter (DMT)-like permease